MGDCGYSLSQSVTPEPPTTALKHALRWAWPPLKPGSYPCCPGNVSQLLSGDKCRHTCLTRQSSSQYHVKVTQKILLMFSLCNFRKNINFQIKHLLCFSICTGNFSVTCYVLQNLPTVFVIPSSTRVSPNQATPVVLFACLLIPD